MATNWTKAQEAAIGTSGRDILVAAAAGSGKTAVLVERILQKVTDKTNPVDIDRLLVVTFTKAAAAEMKERIGLALERALAKEPSPHLERQLALLSRAKIMTIDSFCLEVVRQNDTLLDLDPAFRVGEESELALLREEVLDAIFEENYEADGNAGFLALVETYGGATTDRGLKDLVLSVYAFCQSHPFPMEWLHEAVEKYRIRPEVPFGETLWGWYLWQETSFLLTDLEQTAGLAVDLLDSYRPTLQADLELLERLRSALDTGPEGFYQALHAAAFTKLARKKKDDDPVLADRVKALREQIKGGVKELKEKLYFKPPAEMKAEFQAAYPLLLSLEALVNQFDERFRAEKREKLLADFNDLEHDCLQVLLAAGSTVKRIVPSPVALELRERFEEVLCDEYQDSNLVQELLLQAVSRGNNRFLVGDVKQSIYRFRLAQPELFMEKYRDFAGGGRGLRIDLSQNFRSREHILACTNLLFSQLMDEFLGDIPYDADAALYPGADYPAFPETGVGDTEVLVLDLSQETEDEELAELSGAELEAAAIARRIQALLDPNHPYPVWDREENRYRPARYRDVVILLRSPGTWGHVLVETLSACGIPSYAESQGGYYDTVEVLTVLNLLRVIDNPRQDIPLLAVLHSPIYAFSSERLLDIKTRGGQEAFYDCLLALAEEKDAAAFLADLERWRDLAVHIPVEDLLWRLYQETGYFEYIGVTPGGGIRQANLQILLQKAAAYGKAGVKSLFHFVRYLTKMEQTDQSANGARLLKESGDLVRIMSIHKSKGLEFPIVILGGLGKRMNQRDLQKPVLLHQAYGIGVDVLDLEKRIQYKGVSKALLGRKIARENLSEELRVLYVALTRAKEKLILTGGIRNLEKAAERWALSGTEPLLPRQMRMGAGCYLDWIMPALLRTGGEASVQIHYLNKETALSLEPQETGKPEAAAVIWDADADFSGRKNEVYQRLEWRYPYESAVDLPANISVSEIKRLRQAELLPEGESLVMRPTLAEPQFLQGPGRLTGAQKGTALHTLLEGLDFTKAYTLEEMRREIADNVSRGRLTEAEASAVRPEKILRFFNSELGLRMRRGEGLVKEQSFALILSPEEIYGGDYAGVAEEILLHGIIDCYFAEADGMVLVDYKTDRGDPAAMVARYRLQLSLYRQAIEQITGKQVKESWLYLFASDQAVRVQ